MPSPAKLELMIVDDEPNILVGLRRSMTAMRDRWNVRFAGSGREALELLARQPADVVVSDLSMPDMDGVELLMTVKVRHPNAVRVILSGSSGRDSLYRALGCAHQYLTKPCNPKGLQAVIERVHKAQTKQITSVIRQLVGSMAALPQLPQTYRRLVDALQDPEIGIHDIAAIVAEDLAASTHVLRLVNSGLFSLSRSVPDVQSAVALLGIETVKGIVLSQSLFNQAGPGASWFDPLAVRDHSHVVAALARSIGELDGAAGDELADLFTAAIVHDVGLLLMAAASTSDTGGPAQIDPPDRDWEVATFGASRYSLGAYLLTMWGFSPRVVDAITMLDGPIPPEVGLAWWLRSAHELVLKLGLTRADIDRTSVPFAEDLTEALAAIRPPLTETDS